MLKYTQFHWTIKVIYEQTYKCYAQRHPCIYTLCSTNDEPYPLTAC